MYEEYYKKAILFFITEGIHFPRNAYKAQLTSRKNVNTQIIW